MSETYAEIPHIVEALVRRLLSKAPGDRLQTADKVILAIDALTSKRAPTTTPLPSAARATMGKVVTGSTMTTLPGSVVMAAQALRTSRLRWAFAGLAALAAFLAAIAIAIVAIGMRRDDAARATLAEPAAPPSEIDVVVDSAPSGAEVLFGGAVRGTTPFAARLPRGERDVELVIRLAGYVDRTILVHPTAPVRERVMLARDPAAAVPKRSAPDRDRSVNPFD